MTCTERAARPGCCLLLQPYLPLPACPSPGDGPPALRESLPAGPSLHTQRPLTLCERLMFAANCPQNVLSGSGLSFQTRGPVRAWPCWFLSCPAVVSGCPPPLLSLQSVSDFSSPSCTTAGTLPSLCHVPCDREGSFLS